MAHLCFQALVVQLLLIIAGVAVQYLRQPSEQVQDVVGTRWAVLIAGSKGYGNYRHQADVCHAYQILKKGGLKEENIIVFMYDDIANNPENPWPGVIINNPTGVDVYAGVPKDYTGMDVNVNNFLAVLLGNESALTGGSRKVVNSSADDHIFVYYSDHGCPGYLEMPAGEHLYAIDLVGTLEEMHAAGKYKSLLFYLEACYSGSIFEGLLPADINVYATTAANAMERSWATYCPCGPDAPPPEFYTCVGDLYSVSWMEDSEKNDRRTESLKQQYDHVKNRTWNQGFGSHSHVMQYGDLDLNVQKLYLFMGTNPAKDNPTFGSRDSSSKKLSSAVSQTDAYLLYFWQKYQKSAEGSSEKSEARNQLMEELARRFRVDSSIEMIGGRLFGSEEGPKVLNDVRPAGQPLVDDWDCLKSMVRSFEEQCGTLGQCGKHTRAFANMCNAGVGAEAMSKVASQACSTGGPFEF